MKAENTVCSIPVTSTNVSACPACGAGGSAATGSEALGLIVSAGERKFLQPSYSIRECSRCGLLYRTPVLTAEQLRDYYSLVDFRKWEIPDYFPPERATLSVLRTLPRGARLLDFGCSTGRLFAPLTGDYECHGFEVNALAAADAAAKGIKMLSRDSLATTQANAFDAVVLVDVFEHLLAPMDVMRWLFGLLKPMGLLVIATGNGDAKACRRDPGQFWYFRNIEHLCMMTRVHAEFLSRELGARLIHWQELSHYDMTWDQQLRQRAQDFAYWQFRRDTLLARTLLSRVPVLNRARHWTSAPCFSCSRDHVLAILSKSASGC